MKLKAVTWFSILFRSDRESATSLGGLLLALEQDSWLFHGCRLVKDCQPKQHMERLGAVRIEQRFFAHFPTFFTLTKVNLLIIFGSNMV
jgi:Leu/Phe-tRNA-protein transferase